MVFSRARAFSGLPCAQADLDHVAHIVTASGTSFARGMKVLPAARRQAMFAIYAFCRQVDDIADGDTNVADPAQALQEWHERIDRLYQGKRRTHSIVFLWQLFSGSSSRPRISMPLLTVWPWTAVPRLLHLTRKPWICTAIALRQP